jgi:hypothetical protein
MCVEYTRSTMGDVKLGNCECAVCFALSDARRRTDVDVAEIAKDNTDSPAGVDLREMCLRSRCATARTSSADDERVCTSDDKKADVFYIGAAVRAVVTGAFVCMCVVRARVIVTI